MTYAQAREDVLQVLGASARFAVFYERHRKRLEIYRMLPHPLHRAALRSLAEMDR